jgi:hypothetical protein
MTIRPRAVRRARRAAIRDILARFGAHAGTPPFAGAGLVSATPSIGVQPVSDVCLRQARARRASERTFALESRSAIDAMRRSRDAGSSEPAGLQARHPKA